MESYRRDLDLVWRFERRARTCSGLLPIRLHDMRHTHATLLLESGESVKYVAERLGDREDTVVETYAHVTPRMRSSAVSKVRSFFGTGSPAVEGDVAMPHVDTGAEVDRDLPVTSQGPTEAYEAHGGA